MLHRNDHRRLRSVIASDTIDFVCDDRSDGSGGKRAQHRRMKPQKLAQELKKRGLYDDKASREEMEIALHKAVEGEPCCANSECSCVKNGLGCQSDACNCWHDSHVHEKKGSGSNHNGVVPTDEIERRCGNSFGMYAVDLESIDRERGRTLAKFGLGYCQPVSASLNHD